MRDRLQDDYVGPEGHERAQSEGMSREKREYVSRIKAHNALVEYAETIGQIIDMVDHSNTLETREERVAQDREVMEGLSDISQMIAQFAQGYAILADAKTITASVEMTEQEGPDTGQGWMRKMTG